MPRRDRQRDRCVVALRPQRGEGTFNDGVQLCGLPARLFELAGSCCRNTIASAPSSLAATSKEKDNEIVAPLRRRAHLWPSSRKLSATVRPQICTPPVTSPPSHDLCSCSTRPQR